jgi:hypothetical protein
MKYMVGPIVADDDDIVTWRLKAGIVKSEKTAIGRQRPVETRFRDDQL